MIYSLGDILMFWTDFKLNGWFVANQEIPELLPGESEFSSFDWI